MEHNKIESTLSNLLKVVFQRTDYLPWTDFHFQGNRFSVGIDTYKGDTYVLHETGSIRLKLGNLRITGDTAIFEPLLQHLADMDADRFFGFLMDNQIHRQAI